MLDQKLVTTIRELLDQLVNSRNLDNDDREEVADRVAEVARGLPREGLLPALDRAVGKNVKRRREAVYLLSEFTDVPEVTTRIGDWLQDPDPEWRSWLVQVVKHRRLVQFGRQVAEMIASEPDSFCRDQAIHTAGTLRIPEALPTVLNFAEHSGSDKWILAWALKEYATEECRPFLARWLADETLSPGTRVVAAWGLAKLGDQQALAYLVKTLDDPDVKTPTSYRPGESLRAAQALCDLYGWPFVWNKSQVAITKECLSSNS